MKRFTIIFSILLVLAFAGTMAYVAASDEFVAPAQLVTGEGEDPDAPVWDITMDDLVAYLEGEGLIDSSTEVLLASTGMCSVSFKYSGAEFYYWDLDALEEDSVEYEVYEILKKDGIIDVYNSGSIISPASNGPFAVLTTYYEGDPDALTEAFLAFGKE